MNYLKNKKIWIFLFLAGVGISFRFFDFAPNFTPAFALILFGGYYFKSKWSVLLPIFIMLFSDMVLGFYDVMVMLSVYISFVLVYFIGRSIKERERVMGTFLGWLSGSLLFFVITNFSVWYFTPWYPSNVGGLIECFVLAIPFFKNSLLGNLFFIGVVFGIYELCLLYSFLFKQIKDKFYAEQKTPNNIVWGIDRVGSDYLDSPQLYKQRSVFNEQKQ
jgi:hypothetical protein